MITRTSCCLRVGHNDFRVGYKKVLEAEHYVNVSVSNDGLNPKRVTLEIPSFGDCLESVEVSFDAADLLLAIKRVTLELPDETH